MRRNSTIIICIDALIGAAVIARKGNAKKQIKSCGDCKGDRAKKNQNAKFNERGFGCG